MAGPGMMGPGMPPQGVMPASYESPMMGYPGGMGCPTCGGMGGAGCPTCSAAGYGPGYGEERGFDFLRRLLPYPAGGWASPRWFDVSADFVYITRDETAASRVDFMSDGPRGFGPPNVVLSTDDLDFDEEPGFRATAAFQIGPSGNIEFTYLGTFHWASSAAVSSEFDELYSAFSDFGTNPPPVPGVSPGGFQDSDAAEFASLGYSSEINSYELSFRRRWMFPNSRVQGSWLAGARYFRLEEEIQNFIVVNYDQPGPIAPFTGGTDFLVATDNSMTGFQLGGDLWATVFPGLLIGVDGRGGIYGNRAEQTTFITTASSGGTFVEQLDTTEAAFVGEANVIGVWRVNQHLSLRGGYQVLYVDGVALAPDNVNFQPPAIAGPGARTAMINANGEALYHGLTAGLELMW